MSSSFVVMPISFHIKRGASEKPEITQWAPATSLLIITESGGACG